MLDETFVQNIVSNNVLTLTETKKYINIIVKRINPSLHIESIYIYILIKLVLYTIMTYILFNRSENQIFMKITHPDTFNLSINMWCIVFPF